VIVDDEPLAREGMANYVKDVAFLQLVDTCVNPVELGKLLGEQKIDLIFLDIQMPKMNGIDFLRVVQKPPMVIITTAFPGYALEGFQLNVLDYLLKPITFDRFQKAAKKAHDYFELSTRAAQADTNKGQEAEDYFFIKCGNKYEKIQFADVLYAQGLQNYVTIYTTKGKYLTLLHMKKLEENFDPQAFIRVHKSFIVSISKIESIDGNELVISSHRIPISRNYRDQVIKQVVNNNLWIK
jgi:DNA-binding LytR/AlgR family response regulator